jgi:hypothetical protein
MSSDEVSQIKVGGDRLGIIGLKSILAEVAETFAARTDEEIRTELLKRLNQRNYIAESSKEKYGQAFLREFKKFTGRPIEDSDPAGVEIKVLGPGCARCNQLEQDLMVVMSEMGMPADIEHVYRHRRDRQLRCDGHPGAGDQPRGQGGGFNPAEIKTEAMAAGCICKSSQITSQPIISAV